MNRKTGVEPRGRQVTRLLCAAMTILRSTTTLTIALALVAGFATPLLAAVGEWSLGSKARIRLIAAGVEADGKLGAGIEIELAPGWKTYWRTPGAAGIAPRADFSASSNVRDVTVRYPVPHRFDDGYAVTNVYEGRVILPLAVDLGDRTAPADLRLSLDLGVCEEVCIPEHFDTDLAIAPGTTDQAAARALDAAVKELPGPPEPGVLAVDGMARNGGTDKQPVYDFTLAVPAAKDAEVFVEGPADWYAAVPDLVSDDNGRAVYRVAFNRLGAKTPIEGARFTVTIVTSDRAVEQTVGLD
jgi:DsbC/DsbD-like thiol-disulfide interchange protein